MVMSQTKARSLPSCFARFVVADLPRPLNAVELYPESEGDHRTDR
jgi:hypothetical protein